MAGSNPTRSSTKARPRKAAAKKSTGPSGARGRSARRARAGWRYTQHVDRWVKAGWVAPTEYEGTPLVRTPAPKRGEAVFDPAAVERVVKFFCLLQHVVGRWAGVDFRLLDWQVEFFAAPVFGLKDKAGLRIVRTVWFEIPRKNGKSTLAAGVGLYLISADREAAAEVYVAAAKKEQAANVFRPAKKMAEGSPRVSARLKILGNLIEHKRTGSFFRAIAAVGDLEHGSNVHGAIIDEVHVHKSRDTVDALETGTGARLQPLVVFITTADSGGSTTIYAEKRGYCELVAKGTVRDASFYGCVFGADKDAEDFAPFDRETIARANPGAGITVTWEYLLKKAEQAQASPGALNAYLRLHLNVRTGAHSAWLKPQSWDAGAGLVVEEELRGRDCFGGLDLASTSDFTACAWLFPPVDDDVEYDLLMRFWIPRAAVVARKDLQPLFEQWEAEGFVRVTDGDVQDQDTIRADLEADLRRFNCTEFAYDPWNAGFVPSMANEGLAAVELRQTIGNLSPATKQVERWVGARALRHGGNPVLRWMVGNVTLFTDSAGNQRPDKAKSHEKIDGVAALVNATACAIREREVQYAPASARPPQAVGDGGPSAVYRGGARLDL